MSEVLNKGATDFGLHMKPLLAVAVKEAVKLALIDSVVVPDSEGPHSRSNGSRYRYPTDEEKSAWTWDIYAMPEECLSTMDPMALAQNVCVRLFGGGGWTVSGVYAGNATAQQVLDACVYRPVQDPLGDIKQFLGVKEEDES